MSAWSPHPSLLWALEVCAWSPEHFGLAVQHFARLVELDPQRVRPVDSEIARLVCDRSEVTAMTSWEPETDLRTGLERTLAWIRSHRDLYREEYAT